jgi:hypothetical protein
MPSFPVTSVRRAALCAAPLAAAVLAVACSDRQPLATREPELPPPATAVQAFDCTGSTAGTLSCRAAGANTGGASGALIGGQNTYVKLTSSNVAYNSGTGIFSFDVTVQNLMNEAIGTPDGVTADPQGIQVFFHDGPNVTGGTGSVTVANPDGTGAFTGASQPYYAYAQILTEDQISAPKTWQLNVPATVATFSFTLFIETDVQPLLVINEVQGNPGGTVQDSVGEYVELYNRGTRSVNLQGFQVSDNSGTTENTPHTIAASLVVPSGGYVVLGRSNNTAVNGGIAVDYVYSPNSQITQLQFSNSAADVFRVRAPNGVVVDSVTYAAPATTFGGANTGVARELKNPTFANADIEGTNWASSTNVYDATNNNKGTPKAQNSVFVAVP